jgi:hypothetical protein
VIKVQEETIKETKGKIYFLISNLVLTIQYWRTSFFSSCFN